MKSHLSKEDKAFNQIAKFNNKSATSYPVTFERRGSLFHLYGSEKEYQMLEDEIYKSLLKEGSIK